MADNGAELRGIAWSQAFPFLRLFQTLRLALDFKRLMLALACVLLTYIGGVILDSIWLGGGRGVPVMPRGEGRDSAIAAYTQFDQAGYSEWEARAVAEPELRAVRALQRFNVAASMEEARRKLDGANLRELLLDADHSKRVKELRTWVTERLKACRDALDDDTGPSAQEKEKRRSELEAAADTLRRALADRRRAAPITDGESMGALMMLLDAEPALAGERRAPLREDLGNALKRQAAVHEYEWLQPRGPFLSLLAHEERCFAGAIQGVCAGRWGYAGGVYDAEPAMIGSMASAVRGIGWLLLQRPVYAVIFGLFMLLVFAYFGGGLCRSAAVQSAREETISLGAALRFASEKYGGLLTAPLMPVVMFMILALLIFVFCGLIGAIPVFEILTGIFYPLTLLGGFVLAIVFLATLLGFHLMWPTIAVEGSDGFDAVSRAFSYIGSRIWHVGFYSFVLLLYGGVSFVLVRLVAMLSLKMAHTATKLGMNLASNAQLDTVGKLDGIWQMPAWADLSILPSVSGAPFWGAFETAPLDWSEAGALFFFRLWIYLIVALLGAFVVSFFYCGSTQMYFLLRREVDATDFEEVYYEEPEEEVPPPTAPAAEAAPPATAAQPQEQTPAAPPPQPEPPAEEAPPAEEGPPVEQAPPAEEGPPVGEAPPAEKPPEDEPSDETPTP